MLGLSLGDSRDNLLGCKTQSTEFVCSVLYINKQSQHNTRKGLNLPTLGIPYPKWLNVLDTLTICSELSQATKRSIYIGFW